MEHFLTDMSNRVEHQKQNQPAIVRAIFSYINKYEDKTSTKNNPVGWKFWILHLNQRGTDQSPPRFFDMSNRVEHQKLNQLAARAASWLSLSVQLGLRQTQALINTYFITIF